MIKDYVVKCAEAKDYAPLIWRLRSGLELSEKEREFLADYLEGKRAGRGRGASPRGAWKAAAHFELFYWLTEYEGRQPDHAYDEVAEVHGISRRKVIEAVKVARNEGHAARIERADKGLRAAIAESDDQEVVAVMREWLETKRQRLLRGENMQAVERL